MGFWEQAARWSDFRPDFWPDFAALTRRMAEDESALFDSARGYLEQMTFYKEHQRKPTTGRAPPRSNGGGSA